MKIENGILLEYDGPEENVVIPSGVTSIGNRLFYRSPMKTLHISEGVVTIEQSAFSPCDQLVSVSLPESLHTLKEFAFSCCRNITGITLPKGLSIIEKSAFSMCKSLKSIELPEALTELNESVFLGCTSLKKAFVPKNIKKIHHRAFADCTGLLRITVSPDNPFYRDIDGVLYSKDGKRLVIFPGGLLEVTIPEETTEIGEGAFYYNLNFDRIKLPPQLKSIGESAFYRCCELTGMNLPETLEKIERSAFEGCSKLKNISIPANVSHIGEGSFRKCDNLMWIELPESLPFDIHWFCVHNDPPAFSADQNTIPFVNNRPINDITSKMGLRRAALGFILADCAGVRIENNIRSAYMEYVKSNWDDFEENLFEYDDILSWMCSNQVIPADSVERLLEIASDRGRASTSAILLDYQAANKPAANTITKGGQIDKRFEALENAFDL